MHKMSSNVYLAVSLLKVLNGFSLYHVNVLYQYIVFMNIIYFSSYKLC